MAFTVTMTEDTREETNTIPTLLNAQDPPGHIETSMHGRELRVQPQSHILKRVDMTETWKLVKDGIQIGRELAMRRASMATTTTLIGMHDHHSTSRV